MLFEWIGMKTERKVRVKQQSDERASHFQLKKRMLSTEVLIEGFISTISWLEFCDQIKIQN
jgi:hypothetical protein